MSIGRANDWFGVSGFTQAFDDFYCLSTTSKIRSSNLFLPPEHTKWSSFSAPGNLFLKNVQICYVPVLVIQILVFSGGTAS